MTRCPRCKNTPCCCEDIEKGLQEISEGKVVPLDLIEKAHSPDRDKRVKAIIADARSTSYADAQAGYPAYRIGNMDFEKAIIALFDEEEIRKQERGKLIKVIEDCDSIGFPYGADFKRAILQALTEGKK